MEYIKCIDNAFCKSVMSNLYIKGFNEIEYSIHSNGTAVDFAITLFDGQKIRKTFSLDSLNNCNYTYPEAFIAQSLGRCVSIHYADKGIVSQRPDLTISSLKNSYKFNRSYLDCSNAIDKVIFNDPATIVFWNDGTKTITKCGELDIYDPEKGLAMCFAKKLLGNEGNYYNVFKKWLPKEDNDLEQGCPFDEPPLCRELKAVRDKIYDKITNGGC